MEDLLTQRHKDNEGNTFQYSTEEMERIMRKESLFDHDSQTLGGHTETELIKKLKKLYAKETSQDLHALSLSHYLRNKRIPRGLRIQRSPTIGKDNDKFCDRWCEILNKCSFDLMTLVIQEENEQLERTRMEIESATQELATKVPDKEKLDKIHSGLQEHRTKGEETKRAQKREKYRRNEEDYTKNDVYFWRNRNKKTDPDNTEGTSGNTHNGNRNHRARYDNEWTSNSSLDSHTSTQSTEQQRPFLGDGRRGRGRGRGAGGGKRNQHSGSPPSTRSRTRL